MLDQNLQVLFNQLWEAIEQKEDITSLLKGISRDDFLSIFRKKIGYGNYTLLGDAVFDEHLKAVETILNMAKEKGVLKEIVTKKITKSDSLVDYITSYDFILLPKVLDAIKESCGLEAFLEVIEEDSREKIGNILKRNFQFEERIAANKAMKVGIAFGVITALAVGGGYFAAGTNIGFSFGMAVAAALAVGVVAGVITYAVSKPSNELGKINVQQNQETELQDMSNRKSCHLC